MFSKEIKLKINENKVSDGNSPRFTITYNIPKGYTLTSSQVSHKIISLLSGNNDVFIELNSSLLSLHSSKREKEVLGFVQTIKDMNLDYRYKKLPGRPSGNIFANILKKESSSDHEILAFIPKDTLTQDSFKTILPNFGARYYLCKENIDTNRFLDDMNRGHILDDEKLDLFKYIIFDCNVFSQMGIVCANTTLEELQKILI